MNEFIAYIPIIILIILILNGLRVFLQEVIDLIKEKIKRRKKDN